MTPAYITASHSSGGKRKSIASFSFEVQRGYRKHCSGLDLKRSDNQKER
jgi:hypothetical protein